MCSWQLKGAAPRARLLFRTRRRVSLHVIGDEPFQKRLPRTAKFFFQPQRAMTIAAGPRFCSIFVPATTSRVRVLYAWQIEVFFPVWAFFRQRRITETGFNPRHDPGSVPTRLLHVVHVLVASDRAAAECLLVDRMDKSGLFPCFDESFYKVSHWRKY